MILVPPLVFALGSGWLLGRLRPWLLYVWMLLPLPWRPCLCRRPWGCGTAACARPIPDSGDAGPGFLLPAAAWAVQGLLLAAGVLLLLVAGKGKKVYNQ
ncbi:MAG: hypothetical protein ACLRIS_05090 [Flavonifractor plautii]